MSICESEGWKNRKSTNLIFAHCLTITDIIKRMIRLRVLDEDKFLKVTITIRMHAFLNIRKFTYTHNQKKIDPRVIFTKNSLKQI